MINFGAEAAATQGIFKYVAVVTGRFAPPQSEDVGKANQHRHECQKQGHDERRTEQDEQNEKYGDARANSAD
jgi:hypothetical protein